MALQKSKTLANGATGDYWKIVSFCVDRVLCKASYVIALFSDQAHGQANTPSLGLSKKYTFSVDRTIIDDNLVTFGYSSIKTKAATIVSVGIDGSVLSPAAAYDSDLDGATDV